jgi:hypothetical protein
LIVFEKKGNNQLPGRRSDHVSLARLFKAGSTNAYPFSVAAATVDTDHRYQSSLRDSSNYVTALPGFEKPG